MTRGLARCDLIRRGRQKHKVVTMKVLLSRRAEGRTFVRGEGMVRTEELMVWQPLLLRRE